MKMDQLRFVSGTIVDFPMMGADPSGPFVLKNVDGLGPPQVGVRMARTVLEQATYQGKSSSLRQIIATVALQPNWDIGQTAEELRTQLYSLLTPRYGLMVQAQIMYEGEVVGYAQGQVSNMEPAIFAKDPAVVITLDCDYPYFLGPNVVVQEPEHRAVSSQQALDVINEGTAPAGFRMGVILRAPVTGSLILSDADPRGQRIQIDGINWVAGDKLCIDTRPGYRNIYRGAGGGIYQSVLNNLNASVSEWIQLYGGDNTLMLNVSALDWDEAILFSHQPAYWGV